MAQGIPGEATNFAFTVTFYCSPAGTWSIDIDQVIDWAKQPRRPLASGTADRSLSFPDQRMIAEVVSTLTETGIARMVMPF